MLTPKLEARVLDVTRQREGHPLFTDDHKKAIARAVERVRDLVDWDGS